MKFIVLEAVTWQTGAIRGLLQDFDSASRGQKLGIQAADVEECLVEVERQSFWFELCAVRLSSAQQFEPEMP